MLVSSLCRPCLCPVMGLPASPVGPSCLPAAADLGQLRHCRPFRVRSAQWGSPGRVSEAGSIWWGGACSGDKEEVSIFWNGVRRTDRCPLASRRRGGDHWRSQATSSPQLPSSEPVPQTPILSPDLEPLQRPLLLCLQAGL